MVFCTTGFELANTNSTQHRSLDIEVSRGKSLLGNSWNLLLKPSFCPSWRNHRHPKIGFVCVFYWLHFWSWSRFFERVDMNFFHYHAGVIYTPENENSKQDKRNHKTWTITRANIKGIRHFTTRFINSYICCLQNVTQIWGNNVVHSVYNNTLNSWTPAMFTHCNDWFSNEVE